MRPQSDLVSSWSSASTSFGPPWVDAFHAPHLYLNRTAITAHHLDATTVERAAADAAASVPGIFTAVTRTQVLDGRLPDILWAKMIANGSHRTRSGDVLVIEAPGAVLASGTGTTDGSPWPYDSHVPLLMAGFNIPKLTSPRSVDMTAVAPTLARMLGIPEPSGSVGELLREVLPQ